MLEVIGIRLTLFSDGLDWIHVIKRTPHLCTTTGNSSLWHKFYVGVFFILAIANQLLIDLIQLFYLTTYHLWADPQESRISLYFFPQGVIKNAEQERNRRESSGQIQT